MVRVAGVQDQIEARIDSARPDGLSPTRLMEAIATIVRAHGSRQARQFTRGDRARARASRASGSSPARSRAPRRQKLERYFLEHIFPVLTPLAIGPGRPFPYISNLSLSLLVHLRDPAATASSTRA